ncbi:DUF2059 domain-containing protein [Pacificispira sp.]|uniref:DUF2059 domain-containing protein n=1 Tax=Pacificispira sp. TaxID=2888761 RepID=UPI003BAC910F
MRRLTWLVCAAVLATAGGAQARAQTMLLPVVDVVGSGGPGTGATRELVDELLILLQYDQVADRIVDDAATDVVRRVRIANPHMTDKDAQAVRQLFEDAVRRSAPDLTQASRSMLLRNYSEQELRELIAFYRTPVGQKSIRLNPELSGEIASRAAAAVSGTLPPIVEALSVRLRAAGFRSPEFSEFTSAW